MNNSDDAKRRVGRPRTRTSDEKKEQNSTGQQHYRSRLKEQGRTPLSAVVSVETKQRITQYMAAHGIGSIGEAIDKICSKIK